MRQQINLYQDILIEKAEPLQSRQALRLVALVVLCLVLFGAFRMWQVERLEEQRAELQQQADSHAEQLAQLEQKYPAVKKNVLLEQHIRRLERSIQTQKQALDFFSRQDGESNTVMLASLESLARNPLQGVWLNHVDLGRQGREVELMGSATEADLVPQYLSLLSEKQVFGGRVFSKLRLERVEDEGTRIDFVLSGAVEESL